MIELLPIVFKDVWYHGGAVVYLGIVSLNNWTDEDGDYHLAGSVMDKRAPQKLFEGIVQGNSLLFENVIFPPTTTSPDRPNTRLSFVIYDSAMRPKLLAAEEWTLPDDLDPLTWANLAVQNAACGCGLDDVRFYNRAQVDFQIQEAINNIVLQNMPTATGLAEIVGGAVVVVEPLVTAFSRIVCYSMSAGVSGVLRVNADEIVAGVGFTIRSSEGGDNGNVAWSVTEP